MTKNKHVGSSFEEWLEEEAIKDEVYEESEGLVNLLSEAFYEKRVYKHRCNGLCKREVPCLITRHICGKRCKTLCKGCFEFYASAVLEELEEN